MPARVQSTGTMPSIAMPYNSFPGLFQTGMLELIGCCLLCLFEAILHWYYTMLLCFILCLWVCPQKVGSWPQIFFETMALNVVFSTPSLIKASSWEIAFGYCLQNLNWIYSRDFWLKLFL